MVPGAPQSHVPPLELTYMTYSWFSCPPDNVVQEQGSKNNMSQVSWVGINRVGLFLLTIKSAPPRKHEGQNAVTSSFWQSRHRYATCLKLHHHSGKKWQLLLSREREREKERERESERENRWDTHTHAHTHIYVYIYI